MLPAPRRPAARARREMAGPWCPPSTGQKAQPPAPWFPIRAGQDGRASDAQARASLPAPARQNGSAMAGTHTHQEAMGPLAATVVRLIGAFHLVNRLLASIKGRAGGLEQGCSPLSERNQ